MARVAFAATVKHSTVDDVVDILEEYSEDEYDFIAWKRSSMTRMIIWGPIKLRYALQTEFDDFVIRPIGQIVETMQDNRNQWIHPLGESAANVASAQVEDWMKELWSQFDEEEIETDLEDDDLEEEIPLEESNVIVEKTAVENRVLELFGLKGDEVDEEGQSLGFFTFKVSEKEQPETVEVVEESKSL